MQQLYLTGDGASASAAQLMNALNVPFSGFRLTPVRVGGSLRGGLTQFLLPLPGQLAVQMGQAETKQKTDK